MFNGLIKSVQKYKLLSYLLSAFSSQYLAASFQLPEYPSILLFSALLPLVPCIWQDLHEESSHALCYVPNALCLWPIVSKKICHQTAPLAKPKYLLLAIEPKYNLSPDSPYALCTMHYAFRHQTILSFIAFDTA